MYVGGLLNRLIFDNFYNMVNQSLDDLGWFDEGRHHARVLTLPEPLDEDVTVEPNVIAFSDEDVSDEEAELGSDLAEHKMLIYMDVFAEGKAVGQHLAGDLKDIIQGRFTSIGRSEPNFEVLDLTQSSPSGLFFCSVQNAFIERNRFGDKPYQKYWWIVGCEVVWTYANEDDDYRDQP